MRADAARGVCWAALAALLEAGVDPATALAQTAANAPAPLDGALRTAADRTRQGVDPAEALGDADERLRPFLRAAGASLPGRLRVVAEAELRADRITRRVDAIARYPVAVAVGAVVVASALWVAFEAQLSGDAAGIFRPSEARYMATKGILWGALAALGYTVWAVSTRRPPWWVVQLPGGRLFESAAAAAAVSRYALLRNPEVGAVPPEVALTQATDGRALPPVVAAELRLGEAAGRPVEAALELADHLEHATAGQAERLLASLGALFLGLAGGGVIALAVLVYGAVFGVAQDLF